jgi:hypothetical protein
MKNTNYTKQFIFSLFIICLGFSCCKDDDDDNQPPGESASGNFSEYFTCKINGVEFEPQGTFSCNHEVFYYYPAGTAGLEESYMLIKGDNCPENKSIVLRIFGIVPDDGLMNFLEPSYADSCSPFFKHNIQGEQSLIFEDLLSGEMNLTSFTPRQPNNGPFGKIEGTFEFSVANENNDSIIHITDGAFRFKVPNTW